MSRISCLAIARRTAYGSLESAGRRSGVPRSTQQRAEAGQSVSTRTRCLIEKLYGAALEDLQKPFLDHVVKGDQP
jgi:hypothetical protein